MKNFLHFHVIFFQLFWILYFLYFNSLPDLWKFLFSRVSYVFVLLKSMKKFQTAANFCLDFDKPSSFFFSVKLLQVFCPEEFFQNDPAFANTVPHDTTLLGLDMQLMKRFNYFLIGLSQSLSSKVNFRQILIHFLLFLNHFDNLLEPPNHKTIRIIILCG